MCYTICKTGGRVNLWRSSSGGGVKEMAIRMSLLQGYCYEDEDRAADRIQCDMLRDNIVTW